MERLHLDSLCSDLAQTGQVIFHPAQKATEIKLSQGNENGTTFAES